MSSPYDFLAHPPPDVASLAERATAPAVVPLASWGALAVTGPDAERLLQGQLTCDLRELDAASGLKGALCDPKGRVIANLYCLREGAEAVLLLCHRSLVAPTLATLGKYAPLYRGRVALADASSSRALFGLLQMESPTPAVNLAAQLAVIAVAATGASALWRQLTASAAPAGERLFEYALIQAGEAVLTAATSGLFVPQMLNYQATGAVSFRKGCYTGQEVVARLQYRGKSKRWLRHLRLPGSTPPPPGTELASPEGEAATVVAAVADGDQIDLLAVASQSALASGRLLLDGRETAFAEIPLPYGDALERS